MFSHFVQKIIDENQFDAVVGTYVVPPPNARRLIFDLYDNNPAYWLDYRNHPAYAHEVEQSESAYLHKADCIVAVGSVLADLAARNLDGLPKEIVVIPNGGDLNRYKIEDDGILRHQLGLDGCKVIGYISVFGEFSGLLRLIEAFRILNDSKAVLLLVGDGSQVESAKRLTKKYGLTNVLFVGRVPYDEVPKYFRIIDIGIIPFDKTPFTDAACPIKLIEYSAAGSVVVSTNLAEVGRMAFPNVLMVQATPEALAAGIREASLLHFIPPPQLDEYDLPRLLSRFEAVLKGE